LGFFELFVRGDVSDAQDAALLIVEEETLETDLHFQKGRIIRSVL
jgi:hypothetical protein